MALAQTVISDAGVQVVAYDFGGDGPALLLAHATGFHIHAYEPMVARLRAAFHCYGFDQRGHGATPIPAGGDFDWHHFGDDALAVCAHFGLHRPAAFGHSCGGALLVLAEQDHPGSWDRLYLYEPVIFPFPAVPHGVSAEGNPLAQGALKRRRSFPNRTAAVERFSAKPPMARFASEALAAYVAHGFVDTPDGSITLACTPETEAATYQAAIEHGAWDELGRVSCPVTIACGNSGAQDFGPAAIAGMAARMPDAQTQVFEELSHFGPLEDPARVARAILAWLGAGESHSSVPPPR